MGADDSINLPETSKVNKDINDLEKIRRERRVELEAVRTSSDLFHRNPYSRQPTMPGFSRRLNILGYPLEAPSNQIYSRFSSTSNREYGSCVGLGSTSEVIFLE
ncbi:uncharacterized protein LOC111701261 [Eurytemora carolleeae]|uniref:uncharacterized protein LOC111701261 n=1 Tax=Eurytemora carolleeae TaxID=1294199 RepID=UPI000C75B345|nr:uncharacterized protein LOC111701261 [Eurytemora carolleeae]|eukprot:XP_023328225.1 uncharacterized protein LOC111701261 [Eurytemora affinis]